jgi:hypothetical protein
MTVSLGREARKPNECLTVSSHFSPQSGLGFFLASVLHRQLGDRDVNEARAWNETAYLRRGRDGANTTVLLAT